MHGFSPLARPSPFRTSSSFSLRRAAALTFRFASRSFFCSSVGVYCRRGLFSSALGGAACATGLAGTGRGGGTVATPANRVQLGLMPPSWR